MKALILLLAITSTFVHAQTPAGEWHEYCEMTVHVRVNGWEVENVKKQMPIKADFSKLNCKVVYSPTYTEGMYQTVVTANLKVKTDLGTKLAHPDMQIYYYMNGKVDRDVACAKIDDLKNEITPVALVERSLVRQDWTSSKNVDTSLAEKVTISFSNKVAFFSNAILWTKGKYCSQKPKSLR